MVDQPIATVQELHSQLTSGLAALGESTTKTVQRLERITQELRWDLTRLEGEMALKNKEIDMYKQGRGLFMADVWYGYEQERWLGGNVVRYAPEWPLLGFLREVTYLLKEMNICNDEQFQAAYQEMRAKRLIAQRQSKLQSESHSL